MIKYKHKHHRLFNKAMSIALVCLSSVNNLIFADPAVCNTSKNTLAAPTQLTQPEFKERFKAKEFLLAHDAINNYIKTQIEREKEILGKKWEGQKTRKLDLKEYKIRGNIRYDVNGIGFIILVSVTGLLSHTGQFAHVGLSGKNYGGTAVIYIDSQFFNDPANAIQKHDVDEILQWESLRVSILNLKQLALESETLERFIKIIKMIRDKKGYLTTDKTFLLTGVFEYLGRTEEIYALTETGISARMQEGRNLLDSIFRDRIQREKFLEFAIEYQYAYTRRERLVELVNKLISHIRSDPELSKKDVIKLLDIGTAPKRSGSPTAEQTLLMFKTAFPDKRIEVTATDIQFPPNYTFDISGTYIDSRTGIIYKKHNIIEGSLPGYDVVIGVNLLDLYKDENIRNRMRTNIFDSSTAYVITGVGSKEDIWREQAPGEWQSVDTIVLMEKWYPPTVYRKIGFSPEKIGLNKLMLRRDISVNYAFLEPLVDLIDKTKNSRYSAIFRLLILSYIQGNLEGIHSSEWQLGKEVLKNIRNYFPEQNEQDFVRKFIEFSNANTTYFAPKSQVSDNPKDAVLSIRELVNIYVLHFNDWGGVRTKKNPVKILLLQARVDPFDHIPGHQPIGLATLAACANDSAYQATLFSRLNILPDNFEELLSIPFEFKLVDFQTEGPDFSYEAYLKEYKPDIVGIRTVSVSIDEANRLAVATRTTLGKDVKILYGGIHITSLPEKTLRQNKGVVDMGFLAEAEETFPHFLLGMYTHDISISSIPGLCYVDENDQYIETPQRQLVMSLEDHPSYIKYLDLLRNPSGYHVLTEKCIHGTIKSKMALLITSRGCPGKCTFCPTRKLWSSQHIRYQSSDRVLKEMEGYYSKGFRIFYFRDDNFTTNKKRLERICDGIIQRGWKIAWCCMSRVDTVDRELLLKMKESGLAGIAFGVESGDERILYAMDKRAKLLSARKANILCRELGINHKNYIMVGYPREDWGSIFKTMLFLLDIMIGFKYVNEKLEHLGSPAPPDYTQIFNQLTEDLISGKTNLSEFLNQNIAFPDALAGGCNVTFTTPYPGSPLYDAIGKDIYMLAHVFKHGPGERRNIEDFISPVATNEMTREELTEARNIIISLFKAMSKKDMNTINDMLTSVIVKTKARTESSIDIKNALHLMNNLIPAQLEKSKVYEVRYDRARLRENAQIDINEGSPAEILLNEYINYLRIRVKDGDPKEIIKLIDHPNESLLSVICYDSRNKEKTIGESHINIEGDIKGQPLRIIAMLNMAFAASHISNNTPPEELSKYGLLISFIKTQYKEITGKELPSEDIWHIILPAAAQFSLERLEEYYRLTITQLQQAA